MKTRNYVLFLLSYGGSIFPLRAFPACFRSESTQAEVFSFFRAIFFWFLITLRPVTVSLLPLSDSAFGLIKRTFEIPLVNTAILLTWPLPFCYMNELRRDERWYKDLFPPPRNSLPPQRGCVQDRHPQSFDLEASLARQFHARLSLLSPFLRQV